MAIHDLAQIAKQGKVCSVWYDDEEGIFIIQHEFIQIALDKREFEAFLETLARAKERFRELKL